MYGTLTPPTLRKGDHYIYSITGPGGRVYIGQHQHQGEPWDFYTGSGLRLRDEQAYLEPEAFINPRIRFGNPSALERKPGTALRFYTKRFVVGASSREEAEAKEAVHIAALVVSGTPTYNIEVARDAAYTYEQRMDALAYELSFVDPRELRQLRADRDDLQAAHPVLGRGGFDLLNDALEQAEAIRKGRRDFQRRISRR